MSNINDIQTGLRVATQIPLDKKGWFPTIASLIDLGLNNNLAFTYHEALLVYCIENRLRYEWREAINGEVGVIPNNFIYPDNHIVFGINYSLKPYNFFETNLAGPKGEKGDPGIQGTQGVQGVAGPTGQGEKGNDGINGVDGANGADGLNGADGEPGISAYQHALNNGFVGTESQWLVSLKGINGAAGPVGPDGNADMLFRGLISQTTSHPTVLINKNTTGGVISSFIRNSTGVFTLTTSFSSPRMTFRIQSTVLNISIYIEKTAANVFVFTTATTNGSILTDNAMKNCPFEILMD